MHVTAVLVAHDGARHLGRTLAALTEQRRPPDTVVAVDVASLDATPDLLRAGLPDGARLVHAGAGTTVAAAITLGLADTDAHQPRGEDARPRDDRWVWLLHDGGAPDADALDRLLTAVDAAPSVTIAGCKHVEGRDPRTLVDVGIHLSRRAERLTLVDPDEQDQGQHDAVSDVFAVGTSGMLVRRDVWDELGGFDPALPFEGQDVDLCWRNHLAGHRVVVVPRSRVLDVGDHPGRLLTDRRCARRRTQVQLRLTHASGGTLPFVAAGAVLASLWTLLLSLLAKEPGRGMTDLAATLSVLVHPGVLRRSRRRAEAGRREPRSVVRPLFTSNREVRAHRRTRVEAVRPVVGARPVGTGTGSADEGTVVASARPRTGAGVALLAVGIGLTAGVIASAPALTAPAIAGGALLPLSDTAGAVWAHATSWWSTLATGHPTPPDPFAGLLGVLAVLGGGHGSAAVAWLFALAPGIAALTAWFAVGAFTTRRSVRFWAALVYAGLPALQTALGSGRLGAVLAHVLLPLIVLALTRAVGGVVRVHRADAPPRPAPAGALRRPGADGIPSWTAAAAGGLACAAVIAAAPILLPALVVAIAVLLIGLRRRARTVWWALLPPLVLVGPVLVDRLLPASPGATGQQPAGDVLAAALRPVVADPGLPLAYDPAPSWQQVLGFPERLDIGALAGPPGWWVLAAALAFGAPVVLLAVLALFTPPARPAVARGAWLGVVLGVGTGLLAPVAVTGTDDAGRAVTPYGGPAVSLTVLCLLAAAASGLESWAARRRPRSTSTAAPTIGRTARGIGPRGGRIAGVLLGAVLCTVLGLLPLASLAAFAASRAGGDAGLAALTGRRDLVRVVPVRSLPATAADRGTGPERSRTLVLDVTGGQDTGVALMSGTGTTEDALSRTVLDATIAGGAGDDPAIEFTRRAAATIIAADGVDPSGRLEALGAAFVLLKGDDSAAEELASRVDTVPGLVAVGRTDAGWLWRVTPPAVARGDAAVSGRARLVDAQGRTLQYLTYDDEGVRGRVPAGEPGRKVVLAERSDPHWAATVDGAEAARASPGGDASWAQAFAVPAAGGEVHASYHRPASTWWGVATAVVLGVTVLLALPLRMPRRLPPHPVDGPPAATRSAVAAGPPPLPVPEATPVPTDSREGALHV